MQVTAAALAIWLTAVAAIFLLLGALDQGWLDHRIESWASAKMGRRIMFKHLETHLLSRRSSVEVRGLSISNPPWANGGDLADVRRVTAHIRLLPLLVGSIKVDDLAIDGPSLHLIRSRSGLENWTFGSSSSDRHAFSPLAGVQTMTIVEGQLDFRDPRAGLIFRGRISQEAGGSLPLKLEGQAVFQGSTVQLLSQGGMLNGSGVGPPYPIRARLIDGATFIDFAGHSSEPFGLSKYDLAVVARGPNIADLGYLFDLSLANSAPYSFKARARADGTQLSVTQLKGRIGGSDLSGWVRSDRSSSRHKVMADLWSTRWTKADVSAAFVPLPPRALARSISGALLPTRISPWFFSDDTLYVGGIRAIDGNVRVHVGTLTGYALPLTAISARVVLDHGRLELSGVNAALLRGHLWGSAQLDVRGRLPLLSVTGGVQAAQLADIKARKPQQLAGSLDVHVGIRGSGKSPHGIASTSSGKVRVELKRGVLPAPAAFMLGGDLVRAAGTLGKGDTVVGLRCATANFLAQGGKFSVDDLDVETAEGTTAGTGRVDFATERLNLTLTGEPLHRRLFQVGAPILIQGSLQRPSVTVLPGHNAKKLGLKGKLGVLLTPVVGLLPLRRERLAHVPCR